MDIQFTETMFYWLIVPSGLFLSGVGLFLVGLVLYTAFGLVEIFIIWAKNKKGRNRRPFLAVLHPYMQKLENGDKISDKEVAELIKLYNRTNAWWLCTYDSDKLK